MLGRIAALEAQLARLSPGGAAAFLVVLTLLCCLPGFVSLPPVDRDEARFAQTSRQMVATGDLVDLRFQEGTRYKKPAGIYWLQAGAVAATGGGWEAPIWRYRLPSLAAAVASVLLTWRLGLLFGGAAAGLAAGMLMAGVLVLGGEARLAKTDAVLLACILAAQLMLARLWLALRDGGGGTARLTRAQAAAFWAALAAGVLVKGPIAAMVVGLTAGGLALAQRGGRWLAGLRPGFGLLLAAALVLPWYAAITLKAGTAFWDEALGRDLIAKLGEGQEGHGAPPGSYLLALWATFFPASVALALALPALWGDRRTPGVVFAAAWAVPGWLVFEAAATKLVHYTLPFYPALALAVALVWPRVAAGPRPAWTGVLAVLAALVGPGLLAGLAAAAQGLVPPGPVLPFVAGAAAAAAALAGFAAALRRGQGLAALALLALAGAGVQAGLIRGLAAQPALWPAPALVALARDADCPAPALHVAGYAEASLVFLSPGPVRPAEPAAALAALAAGGCVRALVPTADLPADAPGRVLGRVRGLNLGNGRGLDLTVLAPR